MKNILFMRPQAPGACFIPLGILYLIGFLRKSGYDAKYDIIDLRSRSLKREQIIDKIKDCSPDIIGISSLSTESVAAHQLVEICKEILPDVPIILGGPYSSAEWQYILEDKGVDYCVVGEGEETLLKLLKTLDEGQDVATVAGVALCDSSGKPVLNPTGSYIEDLDEIPFPAYELVDLEEYSSSADSHLFSVDLKRRISPIFTSRGCPYRCTFCHNIFGKKIRYRSVKNVMDEIELLVGKYGVGEIHFEDDSFNMDLDRAKEISRQIINRKYDLKFAFPNGIRPEFVDAELVDLFARMGVYSIAYGIESGSEKVRKKIKKGLNLEKLNRTIKLTANRGIIVTGFLMIGLPGETGEEMDETIEFACKSKMHIASFSRVIPFPGTELYNEIVQLGFQYNREIYDGKNYKTRGTINFSDLTDEQLEAKINSGIRKFYLNPARLLRMFLIFPGKLKLISEGFRVFRENIRSSFSNKKHDC